MEIQAVEDRPIYPGDEERSPSVLRGSLLHFGPFLGFAAMLALFGDKIPVWVLWFTAPTPFVFLLAAEERFRPYIDIPKPNPKQFVIDFGYMFVFAILLAFPVVYATWWIFSGIREPSESLAGGWAILAVLVLGDFVGYWLHRSLHVVKHDKSPLFPFGFRMHSMHHTTSYTQLIGNCTVPSPTPTHPLEIPMVHGLMYGFSGAVLGVDFTSTLAAMIMGQMLTMPSHFNAVLHIGPLGRIFCDSDHHRWHHGVDTIRYNLGFVFSFWDKLFGTHHQPHSFRGQMGVRGLELPPNGWERLMVVFPSNWKRMTNTG